MSEGITRKGTCTCCHTTTLLEIIDSALDCNRFYWTKTINCPICNLKDVEMKKVVEER